jgi:peptidylprolyl isomerase
MTLVPRRSTAALLVLMALGLAFALAACGEEEDSIPAGGSAGSGEEEAPADTTETTETSSDPTDTSVKPVIEKPTGAPPRKLVKEDIVEGKGPGAKAGDTVIVNYVGVSFSTGEEFDASWDSGQTFPVQLGAGGVIEGWEKGLIGIKKGGRRELVIPPELGYGAEGSPPAIAPNETLVFVIDAVDIR